MPNLPKTNYLSISEASQYLGVSIDTIRRWDKAGTISSVRLDGKNRYFSVDELAKVKESKPLTISEAASKMGVSVSTLRRLEKQTEIKADRNNRGERVYSQEVINSLLSHRSQRDDVVQKQDEIRQPEETVASYVPEPFVPTPQAVSQQAEQTQNEFLSPIPVSDLVRQINPARPEFRSYYRRFAKTTGLLFLALLLLLTGILALNISNKNKNTQKVIAMAEEQRKKGLGEVLQAATKKLTGNISFNIPAIFNDIVTFKQPVTFDANVTLNDKDLDAKQGRVFASNLQYKLASGSGVILTGGLNPTISNGGVLSLQGLTGAVSLTAGSGISISGTTITNTAQGATDVFKTVKVGSDSFSASGSTDTLELAAGTGISLSTDTTNKKVTITAQAVDSGWTDDGTTVRLSAGTDNVGIGTSTASEKLTVSGNVSISGNIQIGGDTISDFVGSGLEVNSNTLRVNLLGAADGASGVTSSRSGLEFGSAGNTLTLLQGCSNNQILKWDDGAAQWLCSNDLGGSSAVVNVAEGGTVYSSIDTLQFDTLDFNATTSGTQANITIDYASSGITRKNQNETISGAWTFSNAGGVTFSGNGAGLTFSGSGNHDITASSGTLRLGASTLLGAITANNQSITSINTADFGTGNVSISGTTVGLTTDTDLLSLAANALTVNGTITAATDETINGIDISAGAVSDVTNLTINAGGDLTIGTIGLNDAGSNNTNSGATLVGVFDEFNNSNSTTLQSVLKDFDSAIGGGASKFTASGSVLYPNNISDRLGLGTQTASEVPFSLYVTHNLASGATGKAVAVFNQTENQDIFSASSSGTTRFTIANNGNITATGSLTGVTTFNASGALTFGNYTTNGGLLYTNGSGVVSQTGAGSSGTVLHGGTTPSYGAVALGSEVSGTLPVLNGGTGVGTFGGTNTILYTTSADTLSSIATANNGVLITSGGGVPSISSTLPNVVQDNITRLGTVSSGVWNGTAIGSQYGGTGQNFSASTGVPSLSSGTWSVNATLGTSLGGLGGNVTALGAGEILYSTGTTTYDSLAAGSSGQILSSGGAGAPSWVDPNTGRFGIWDQANGAIYPKITSEDLLIGSNASSSAKFAILNVNSGTPIASVSAGANGAAYLTADGTVGTTASQTLTLGGSTTGNIVIDSGTGNIVLNDNTSLLGTLTFNSETFNDLTGNGLTLSGNALTVGLLNAADGTGGTSSRSGLEFGGAGSDQLTLLQGCADNELLTWDASGNVWKCNSVSGVGAGGDITAVGSMTSGAAFADSSANGQWLGLGASAGRIEFDDQAFDEINILAAKLGIGTSTPDSKLHVTGSLTEPVTGKALAIFDQPESQDILTASASGTTRLVLTNAGNLNIIGGSYQIGGTSVLSGTTLGSGVLNSSLTSVGTIGTGVWQGTAIGAQYGGTGINTSASTGVPYISGGTWSVDANNLGVTHGGTGTTTSFTQGSVVFAGASGVYSQDNANLFYDNTNKLLGIGTVTPISMLQLTRPLTLPATGKALAIFDQNESQDIFSASASGTTRLSLSNAGNLNLIGGVYQSGGTSGVTTGAASCVTTTGGIVTGTGTCQFGTEQWVVSNGAIYPGFDSYDFFIGGSATSSAKFAVLNSNSGTPVASVSSGLNGNSSYLTASGNLATERMQSLTLGGSTTGNIVIDSGTGNIVLNDNTSLLGTLTFNSETFNDLTGNGLTLSGNALTVGLLNAADGTGGTSSRSGLEFGGAGSDQLTLLQGCADNELLTWDASGNVWKCNSVSGVGAGGDITAVGSMTSGAAFADSSANGQWLGLGASAGRIEFDDATIDTIAILTGRLGVGTNTPDGELHVTRSLTEPVTGKALAIFDQNENQDVLTASASGTTILSLDRNGGLTLGKTSSKTGSLTLAHASHGFTTTFQNSGSQTQNVTYTLPVDDGTGNYVLSTDGSGVLSWQSVTGVGAGTGTITAVGNIASGDAFTSGTPGSELYFATNGFLGLGSSAGRIAFNDQPFDQVNILSAKLGLGTASPLSKLHVTGSLAEAAIGKSLAIFDQPEAQDIFTASASGTTKFTLANNGDIQFAGASSFMNTLTTTSTAARTYTFPDQDGTVCLSTSSGCIPGTTNYWQITSGALLPIYPSPDLLIGATSTDSAKFAVLNVGTGTPVASVSSGLNGNATYLTASGNLATSNLQDLTLGGASTGNITLDSGSGKITLADNAALLGNLTFNSETFNDLTGNGLTLSSNALTVNLLNAADGTGGTSSRSGLEFGGAGSDQLTLLQGCADNELLTWDDSGNVWKCNTVSGVGAGGDITAVGSMTSGAAFADATADGDWLGLGASAGRIEFDDATIDTVAILTGRLGVGTNTPDGELHVTRSLTEPVTGKALAIFDQNENQDILTASASGTTRLTLDRTGNLNIVGGSYQIGGASVLSSTTLGSSVVNSSLTSVGTIATGVWQGTRIAAGYGGTGIDTSGSTGVPYISGGTWSVDSNNLGVTHGGTGTVTSFTQGSVVFAGASGVYSQDNANLFYDGTNHLLGLGTATPTSVLQVTRSLTLPVTGKSLAILNQNENQNILVGSAAGTLKFAFDNNGNLGLGGSNASSGNYITATNFSVTTAGAGTLATLDTGHGANELYAMNQDVQTTSGVTFDSLVATNLLSTSGNSIGLNYDANANNVLSFGAGPGQATGNLYWGDKLLCDAASSNCGWVTSAGVTQYWNLTNNAVYPVGPYTAVADFLLGSDASSSAKFAVLNIAGGTPTASLSAGANGGAYLTADGTLATTAMQTLTLGGSTTGNIVLNPTGIVQSSGSVNLASGKEYQINGASVLSNNTLGTGVLTSSLTTVGALNAGSITSGFGSIDIGGDSLTAGAGTFSTIDTGLGAHELYAMDQDVRTTSNVTFADLITTGNTTLGNASGDTITLNAAGVTVANDTNFTLSGGVNGLSFDNSTFSVDATNHLIGIGTTSPNSQLHVTRSLSLAATGKALAIFDQNENQDILTASASGTTRLTLDRTGNLNIVGGDYKIGGTSVLSSTTLGTAVVNSSLTSVGALNAGSITSGFGSIDIGADSLTAGSGTFTTLDTGQGANELYDMDQNVLTTSTVTFDSLTATTALATNGNSIGLNLDASANNTLSFGVGAGTATGDLYWGDKLVCSAGSANCGWATSAGSTNYFQLNSNVIAPGGDATVTDRLVLGGSTSTVHQFEVNGKITGKALVAFNETGDQDIFTASASGVTRLTLDRTGNLNIVGGDYQIGGASVLSSTTLGTSVVTSSLTTVGTIGTGVWQGTAVGAAYGGTGINTSGSTGVPSISSGTWSVNATLATSLGGLGANVTAAGAGELLYSTSTTAYNHLAAGSSGQILSSGGAGAPTWIDPNTSTFGIWDQSNGAIYPKILTQDLLLGATATSSAKFAFINVNNGTPTASVSAGTTGAIYLTAAGNLATTAYQPLSIGGATTGDITLNPTGIVQSGGSINLASGKDYQINGTSVLNGTTLGTNVVTSSLTTVGALNAGSITSGFGSIDIGADTLTAGAATFTTLDTGHGANELYAMDQNVLTTSTVTFDTLTATTLLSTSGNSIGLNYDASANNTLSFGAGAGQATGNLYWGDKLLCDATSSNCGWATSAGAVQYWNLSNNAVYPIGPYTGVADLLLGSDATASAKFAVLNIAAGTPTASLSAGTSGGAYLTADGTLATTAMQNLTLGTTTTTGNVILNPLRNVGIGTTSPEQKLTVNGTVRGTDGTYVVDLLSSGTGTEIAFGDTGDNTSFMEVGAYNSVNNIDTKNRDLRIYSTADTTGLTYKQDTGLLGLGTTTPISELQITRALTLPVTGKALTIFNQQENEDILTASAGGTTKFIVDNAGRLFLASTTAPAITTGMLYNNSGAISWNGQGICLADSTNCPAGSGNFWQINSGAISPIYPSLDLLIGSTASSSARFAVLNVGNGTPTASISAISTPNALTLDASGNISTTALQDLTIGSTTAGAVNVTPGANRNINFTMSGTGDFAVNTDQLYVDTSAASVGIGTNTPSAPLEVKIAADGALSRWTVGGTTKLYLDSVGGANEVELANTGGIRFATGDVNTYIRLVTESAGGGRGYIQGTNLTIGGLLGVQGTDLKLDAASVSTTGDTTIGDASGDSLTINAATGTFANDTNFTLSGGVNGLSFDTSTLSVDGANHLIGIGTIAPISQLSVTRSLTLAATGKSLAIFDQNENQDILTASAGGSTKFVINNTGNLQFTGNTSFLNTLTSAATAARTYTFPDATGTVCLSTSNCASDSIWYTASGAILEGNTTQDLLIGGNASSSAKFAVLNMNSGTPTASLSAGTNGGSYLTADGTLATTAYQTLNLGNLTTGNINLGTDAKARTIAIGNSIGATGIALTTGTGNLAVNTNQFFVNQANGTVGIGTVSPLSALQLTHPASMTATGKALAVFDQIENQDIFTASQSGITRFVLAGNGSIAATSSGTTNNAFSFTANSLTSGNGVNVTGNALTTGNLLNLTSTSTALSTGSLAAFDWSPGSSTTATGDLLSLNVGANGIIGNIFNVKDNGSSVFSVSQTAVTANVPVNFTSPGDVAIAYDLNFTNPTASYINSNAPLYLRAGKVYNSSDLTLATYNKGNVIIDSEAFTTLNATASSQLVVGTTTPPSGIGGFYATRDLVNNLALGKSLAIFDQTESQDILTASASGTTKFTISNSGDVTLAGNLVLSNSAGTTGFGGVTYTWPTGAIGGNGYILTTTTGGGLSWIDPGTLPSSNYWDQFNGTLYPKIATQDLLVGGTATASAKFAFINVNNGTPTASISASSGNNAVYLTGAGNLATTNSQTLTLGGSSTGQIVLSPLNNQAGAAVKPGADNLVSLGASSSARFKDLFVGPSSLHVQCLTGDGCGQNLDYAMGVNTATNEFYIGANGRSGALNQYLSISEGGNVTLAGNLSLSSSAGTTKFGGVTYTWPTGAIGGNGYILTTTTGGGLTWIDPGTLPSSNYWDQFNGTLTPKIETQDLLLGGTASSSAKFAVLNMNSGTPTASVSALTSGASYLTADGTLATTAYQTLNLGNLTTGNINLGTDAKARTIAIGNSTGATGIALTTGTGNFALNTDQLFVNQASGVLGVGTASPQSALHITHPMTMTATGKALAIFDQIENQDIFTASQSGITRFKIAGNGAIHATSSATTNNAFTFTGNSVTSGNVFKLNADALTTGYGLNLTSTSTALSSGSLIAVDWSPGSSTTATGDLLSLNIGANGIIGNIFNVKDGGSSVFSVSQTAITANLPVNFTSPGDVGIAYDLNFTNPTASYINSSAPLYLRSGEVFNSSNLTLQTYNSGNIVFDSKYVMVGTGSAQAKFHVEDDQPASVSAMIYNSNAGPNADGLAIKLGYPGAGSTGNHFIEFINGIGVSKGSIQSNGSNGVQLAQNGVADLAEYMQKDGVSTYDYGMIMCIGDNGAVPCANQSQRIAGVMSDSAAVVGGDSNNAVPVGVTGMVKTQVSTENGAIQPGDYITISNTPGVGMKATSASDVIGRAVEAYNGNGISRIKVLVAPTHYDPTVYLTADGNIADQNSSLFTNTVESDALLNKYLTKDDKYSDLVNKVNVLGQKVSDLETQVQTASRSGFIGPVATDSAIPQLTSGVNGLKDTVANHSGEIGTIKSDFDLINTRMTLLESQMATASFSAQMALGNTNAASGSADMFADVDTLNLNNVFVGKDLTVLGRTVVNDLGVTGNITTGVLSIKGLTGEINTIGDTLKLQPLALAGIEAMGGKFRIDTNGSVTTQGNVIAEQVTTKKLQTDLVTLTTDTIATDDAGLVIDNTSTATQSAVLSSSAGQITLKAGQKTFDVRTTALTPKSLLFATPDQPIAIGTKRKNATTFTISIQAAQATDLKINWWIVDTK